MNIAPVQMVDLRFRKISVEVDFEHLPDAAELRDAHSMLENVLLRTEVRVSPMEQVDARGAAHFVTLRVQIDNAVHDDSGQRFSPYLLDVDAAAIVVLAHGAEALGDPEDLISVNGPALVWGSIREQVMTLTARMPAGPVVLPSVNFHDLRKSTRQPSNDAAVVPPTEKKARRARARQS